MNGRTRIAKNIPQARSAVRRRQAGFTLAELLAALAITALVAAGVAMMLYSSAYGTSSQR